MWKRISANKVARHYCGTYIVIERHPHAWIWTVTHTDFTVTDRAPTLHRAKANSVAEADRCLEAKGGKA